MMQRNDEADSLLTKMENILSNQELEYPHAIQYAIKGQKQKALNTLKTKDWFFRAYLYTLLGIKKEAISALLEMTDRIQKSKESKYLLLQNLIIFDNLHPDPRFQEILAKHKELYEENLRKYGDIEL